MEDLLDQELRQVLGSRVREMPRTRDEAMDAKWEHQDSYTQELVTGHRTFVDKARRVSPWASLCALVWLGCAVYILAGWASIGQMLPLLMGSTGFFGWKAGRML